jgi:5-enolpyruvylshikimate-3-phosphate synthase
LALALAVAGMGASGPVEVEGNEVMEESFPGFIEMVRGLEAQAA